MLPDADYLNDPSHCPSIPSSGYVVAARHLHLAGHRILSYRIDALLLLAACLAAVLLVSGMFVLLLQHHPGTLVFITVALQVVVPAALGVLALVAGGQQFSERKQHAPSSRVNYVFYCTKATDEHDLTSGSLHCSCDFSGNARTALQFIALQTTGTRLQHFIFTPQSAFHLQAHELIVHQFAAHYCLSITNGAAGNAIQGGVALGIAAVLAASFVSSRQQLQLVARLLGGCSCHGQLLHHMVDRCMGCTASHTGILEAFVSVGTSPTRYGPAGWAWRLNPADHLIMWVTVVCY